MVWAEVVLSACHTKLVLLTLQVHPRLQDGGLADGCDLTCGWCAGFSGSGPGLCAGPGERCGGRQGGVGGRWPCVSL